MLPAPITILIIDDCSEDRTIFQRFLRSSLREGSRVLEANTGVKGWELATTEEPDCILLDFQLPDFDGLEFVTAINQEPEKKHLPVIMLTGQGDEEVAAKVMACGARDYLVKSKLTPEGLQRAVSNALEKSRLMRTNEEQQRAIQRSQEELEQFAYTLCHDLQAPIRRIVNFVELIQKDLQNQLNERSQGYLDRTIANAVHMRQFIQDVLAYSLIGGDKKPPETVDLNDLIHSVLSDLELSIKKANARIDVGQLPFVLGYPTRFHRLFQNLIGNAVKFRGDDAPLVKVSARPEGAMWHFKVEDNGIGIDADQLEQVFVIFHRLHSSSEYEGSGIGLAMCKKIVDRCGGRIWVESVKGIGTVFHFTIPIIEQPERAEDVRKSVQVPAFS